MVPKLMNCCNSELMGPRVWKIGEENFKSWKTAGSQQRRQKTGGMKVKREESQERSIRGLLNKFENVRFVAQQDCAILREEDIMRERGALPKEEGDAVRENLGDA